MTETEPRAQLDEDELAVLAHAAAGLTWQEAGVALAVSERTVRRRFTDAAGKLGTAGLVQTVAIAVARGLVDPEQPLEPAAITPRPSSRPAAPGPNPSQAITEAIPQICAALPAVDGSLPKACISAGVNYGAVFNRQAKDAELRKTLREAGWVPGKRGPRAPRPHIVAALNTVLTELAGGATITQATERSGIPAATVQNHRDKDEEFRKQFEHAREEGRAARRHLDRNSSWLEPLLGALENGAPFTRACEAVGVHFVSAYKARRDYPELDAQVRAAIEVGKQRSHDSRWRQGDRDDRARREHNKATRDQRRRKTLERFTPEIERALLEVIRNGTPLTEAAEQVGMTQQTLFGRARFDRVWAARLDRALVAGRDPGIGHGTDYAYKVHGCRCPECREAHARARGR